MSAAVTIGRCANQKRWPLPRTTVLLAAIVAMPAQYGSPSLLLPGLQKVATEGLLTKGPADASPGRSLPRLQMHSIEELGGGSQARPISPTTFGSFGSPIGSPDSALAIAFGWSGLGLQQTQGFEPTANGLLSETGVDTFGAGDDGSVPTIEAAAPSGIHAVCSDDRTAMRLQASGEFRPVQTPTAASVQFPSGVFTGRSFGIANTPDDPTEGPSGDRFNLPPAGPTGAWCRPLPVPFARSSPLASRAFWTPFALVLFGFVVFWLSRGVKLPA